MKSIYKTTSPEATMELGEQLAKHLEPGSVVLLFGDLGTGKTHFSKGVARGLEINETIKSPTFTYVNSYQITSEERLAESEELKQKSSPLHAHRSTLTALHHYDLYRLNPGDSSHSIGLEETLHDPTSIKLIEWADRLGDSLPQDYVRVDFKAGDVAHEICFEFHDSQVVPETLVEAFWKEWGTPMHVRDHCRQVMQVALQIGEAFVEQNILLNLILLQTAALLHDVARVCDFIDLDRSKFKEDVTEEKWERWLELRKIFSGQNHANIAFDFLSKLGYQKTAEIIRLHHSLTIIEEAEKFDHLETAIVYYADKRVKHDEIVSLAERFRDGRERYGDENDSAQKKLYAKVEKVCFELEKKLFEQVDLKPEDIQQVANLFDFNYPKT